MFKHKKSSLISKPSAILSDISLKVESPILSDIKPMLATLVDSPVDEDGWFYEIKWDGYRALAYINKGKVELKSRNNKSFNEKFYSLHSALKKWNLSAIFDGEIVVLDNKGFPDFSALQSWRSEADGDLVYYIFDILWFNGYDLTGVSLSDRRKVLQGLVPASGAIRLSDTFDAKASEIFKLAEKINLEGIIAKKTTSLYYPDTRSKEWLKIKTEKHQEAVIGGYTINENTSKKFSALLLGLYEGDKFIYTGSVGTGFSIKQQIEILEKLKPHKTETCPFTETPEYNKPSRFRPNPPKAEVVWVDPKIVAEIKYRTISTDGSFRHPSFKGLRKDKNPKEVIREVPEIISELHEKENPLLNHPVSKTRKDIDRKTLLNPSEQTQVREVGNHQLNFTNLKKIFWPDNGISKRDLLNYYYQVTPYILPYLKDRPQTLNRFPNGIKGNSFYQKDVSGKVPEWIDKFDFYSETDKILKQFLICNNEESLLYIINLGCIEINPWSSRQQYPDNPDWCIIDLDPAETTFDQVIEVALLTKKLLDILHIPSFCKTSGSSGLHTYIPLDAKYTYEESKEFSRALVKIIQAQVPSFTTIERLKSKRSNKMYLDFLQNRPQATVASPYSVRPKPGATVSMPLRWEEVKKGLQISDFTIFNAVDRIKEHGDVFKGVLGKAANLERALEIMKDLKPGWN